VKQRAALIESHHSMFVHYAIRSMKNNNTNNNVIIKASG